MYLKKYLKENTNDLELNHFPDIILTKFTLTIIANYSERHFFKLSFAGMFKLSDSQ